MALAQLFSSGSARIQLLDISKNPVSSTGLCSVAQSLKGWNQELRDLYTLGLWAWVGGSPVTEGKAVDPPPRADLVDVMHASFLPSHR